MERYVIMDRDKEFMKIAIGLSKKSDFPYGSIVVRKDKHLELVTYIAENVNSRDSIKSSTFKKITNDLKDKRIINEDEHRVIFKPPKNINKSEINRALKSLNQQMEEAAEELYQTNKKDDYQL